MEAGMARRRTILGGLVMLAVMGPVAAQNAAPAAAQKEGQASTQVGTSAATTKVPQLTVVVSFPPGGATDLMARMVGEGLRGRYADAVIVENRAGAAGRIGTAAVKGGPNDGSLLLFTPAFPLAIFPHIYNDLPYDAIEDFVPVATTSKSVLSLSVGPAVPESVKTLQDFIEWAKANPEAATFGAPTGGGQHFAGVQFAEAAGVPLRMVPYKGGAPSVVDVLGGHIASVVTPLAEVKPHVEDGKLRLLATTTSERSRFTPDIPTFKELGYDVVFEDWSGLVAPAGLSPERIAQINAAVTEIINSPQGMATMEKIGADTDLNSPEEFAELYRATWERYRDVVKATGFKVE